MSSFALMRTKLGEAEAIWVSTRLLRRQKGICAKLTYQALIAEKMSSNPNPTNSITIVSNTPD
jgi:hypothetical protein